MQQNQQNQNQELVNQFKSFSQQLAAIQLTVANPKPNYNEIESDTEEDINNENSKKRKRKNTPASGKKARANDEIN